jgi:hypothetical protein
MAMEAKMYHDGHRALQDRFASRALADRLDETLRRERFNDAVSCSRSRHLA